MTELNFNTDPNQLTSFDGGSSPESTQTVFKYLWDFVKPQGQDVDDVEPSTSTVATNTIPGSAEIRKVCDYGLCNLSSNSIYNF